VTQPRFKQSISRLQIRSFTTILAALLGRDNVRITHVVSHYEKDWENTEKGTENFYSKREARILPKTCEGVGKRENKERGKRKKKVTSPFKDEA